ncbi:MAG TPA: hypothetical protein VK401_13605 [Propionibacteriaceae bacterium]|jgi:hypothetical protein|nr:hypothetical protein [Propionibacteriaceae bacterium]
MYTLHSASLPPYDAGLSRHAAERHALLTAVKERRAQGRSSAPRRRTGVIVSRPLAVHVGSGSRR